MTFKRKKKTPAGLVNLKRKKQAKPQVITCSDRASQSNITLFQLSASSHDTLTVYTVITPAKTQVIVLKCACPIEN